MILEYTSSETSATYLKTSVVIIFDLKLCKTFRNHPQFPWAILTSGFPEVHFLLNKILSALWVK